MRIILFANGLDHPTAVSMAAALSGAGITFTATTNRPPGPVDAQPCVCSLYDNGMVAQCWSETPLGLEEIALKVEESGAPPAPPAVYQDLTFGEFQDLCYNPIDGGALGRLLEPEGSVPEQFFAGMARYGDIVTAVEAAGAGGGLGKAALQRYQGALSSGFKHATTDTFLGMLVSMTILEQSEFSAIMDAWEELPPALV